MAGRKQTDRPDILFISGSPRPRTCEALIALIEQGAKKVGAKTQRFLLSKKHIHPCTGCGACEKTGVCVLANRVRDKHFIDDYLELKATLERVDAIALVAPLYFAGPPAQLKALFDRMQPYWAQRYLLGVAPPAKRPAQLFVVGGGGDEHGYAPLATIAKSSLAVAGFHLEKVNNFIGFSSPTDAPVYPPEAERDRYSHAQLAKLKRAASEQAAFTQRALDAGGALARYVIKKKEANALAAQLAEVEAELAALNRVGDVEKVGSAEPLSDDAPLRATGLDSASDPAQGGGFDSVSGAKGTSRRAVDPKAEYQAEVELDYSKLIVSAGKGEE
ncbi:MAG: flavodoxin family protein [Coriobacteriales bacterium]|jgi:multimeric flavodoxin WrbA|nr:flavodoxin family protein [Coriobacteriales bacterium]